MFDLGEVFFGDISSEEFDWKKFTDDSMDNEDDDNKVPQYLIETLGFDPDELFGDEE